MSSADREAFFDEGWTLADIADEDTPQRVECPACDGSLGNHCYKCKGKGWVMEVVEEDGE